jgi:nudix-type nucleoside diphosphatase (YffH/AdpP family)
MQKIKEKREIFRSFLVIEEGIIENKNSEGKVDTYSREMVRRDNASCVLIFNRDSQKFILTKQFRFAISDKVKEPILEIMAGKFSDNEQPIEAAIREAKEECGYSIQPSNIEFIAELFASPGYTSEKFYLYYSEVQNSDKVSEGGGLENENEYIEVVEIEKDKFLALAKKGKLADSKTLVSALWYLINKEM